MLVRFMAEPGQGFGQPEGMVWVGQEAGGIVFGEIQ